MKNKDEDIKSYVNAIMCGMCGGYIFNVEEDRLTKLGLYKQCVCNEKKKR